jgi:hypothetical protein
MQSGHCGPLTAERDFYGVKASRRSVAPKIENLATFEWTRDSLIERRGRTTHVYGRWDRLFGWWRTTHGLARDLAPVAAS